MCTSQYNYCTYRVELNPHIHLYDTLSTKEIQKVKSQQEIRVTLSAL